MGTTTQGFCDLVCVFNCPSFREQVFCFNLANKKNNSKRFENRADLSVNFINLGEV